MTQLIVALDDERALKELPRLAEAGANFFKVDPWLLLDHEMFSVISQFLRVCQYDLFLDLKLYQPRDTAVRTARRAWELGTRFLTVFADPVLLKAASACRIDDRQKVIAVGPMTDGTGSPRDLSNVLRYNDECQGIVCSPGAVAEYRRVLANRPVFVCPGVRTQEAWSSDGHREIFSLGEAARQGADYVVVGRPIYTAPDPARVVETILKELTDV